jgi:hypothetical protein
MFYKTAVQAFMIYLHTKFQIQVLTVASLVKKKDTTEAMMALMVGSGGVCV